MSENLQAAGVATASPGNAVARALPSPPPRPPAPRDGSDAAATPPQQQQPQSAPPTPATAAQPREPAASQRAHEAMRELEHRIAQARTDLQFRVDDDLHELIVSVVNAQDHSVIRQIPSEVSLRIARLLQEQPGGLIDSTA
jgi:flagellar protein FlaG